MVYQQTLAGGTSWSGIMRPTEMATNLQLLALDFNYQTIHFLGWTKMILICPSWYLLVTYSCRSRCFFAENITIYHNRLYTYIYIHILSSRNCSTWLGLAWRYLPSILNQQHGAEIIDPQDIRIRQTNDHEKKHVFQWCHELYAHNIYIYIYA